MTDATTVTTKFCPTWKDKDGNRLIFLAKDQIYESYDKALEYQTDQTLWGIVFGLTVGGIFELIFDEHGRTKIRNILADHPVLGKCAVIAGPLLEEKSPS